MKTWIEPSEVSPPPEFQDLVGGHPLAAAALYRRGLSSMTAARAFLDPAQYIPASPFDFPGMAIAVERLLTATRRGETICVWGDFDVDGQTSTAVLVSALRNLHAQVVYHIPVRANESHGVNQPVLERIFAGDVHAAHGWQPGFPPVSLLLTCDTGITSHIALEYTRSQGVDVIITDHHELPDELPAALAAINPHLLPAGHPLETLPGVGVAYKLVEALYQAVGMEQAGAGFLDLAALGIVADLALQTADTRYLLQRGLASLRNPARPGLLAILELAEIDPTNLNEEHIAFALAPRLNALGRLGDANLAVELLTTTDWGQARLLATQLEVLNNRRELQTDQVFKGALAQIERDPDLALGSAIVLANPAWPAGVIGIVASRLVERFQRPAILIATPEGEAGRASARSIEGVDITAVLKSNAALLNAFGGHRMAAGFSIDPLRIDEFRRSINRTLADLGPLPTSDLEIDGYLSLPELTLELVADLERLAPFGAGNPPLVLVCRELQLLETTAVGREGEHLAATVADTAGNSRPVIWWQGVGWPLPEGRFDLAMTVRTSTFRGQRALQAEWIDYRPIADTAGITLARRALEVFDHRQAEPPLAVLKNLAAAGNLAIWAEGEAVARLASQGLRAGDRTSLTPAEALVIWTPPPGPEVLAQALAIVRPTRVHLFSVTAESDQPESCLNRLAGLVKHAIRSQQDCLRLDRLAGAMAQRELTTRKGLAFLQAKGHFVVRETNPGEFLLQMPDAGSGGLADMALAAVLSQEISTLLAETRAYRAYFSRLGDPINSPNS